MLCAAVSSTICKNTPATDHESSSFRGGFYIQEPIFNSRAFIYRAGNPNGKPIVLVHGIGDSGAKDWNRLIPELIRDYDILTFDLPGFGRSDKGNKHYSPENYIRFIEHVSKRYIKPWRFDLIGHSMGASTSLMYAANFPRSVNRLILVDAAGILHRSSYSQYLTKLGIPDPLRSVSIIGELLDRFAGSVIEHVEQRIPIDPGIILQSPELRRRLLNGSPTQIAGFALVTTDFTHTLAKVKTAPLIIWGGKDPIAPLRTGHIIKRSVLGSKLRIIANAKHNPMNESATKFNRLVLSHLEKTSNETEPVKLKTEHSNQNHKVGSCKNRGKFTFSGQYRSISIHNCQNVLINEATIKNVSISGSTVHILNSKITGGEIGVNSVDSKVMVTASELSGETAIRSKNSRLDIAGSQLRGTDASITSITTSTVIFSVSTIESKKMTRSIHSFYNLNPGESL